MNEKSDPPIYVPTELIAKAFYDCGSIKTAETRLLLWFLIDCNPYTDDSCHGWRPMSYNRFALATKNRNNVGSGLDWLLKERYIDVKPFQFFDGNLAKDYRPGEDPCKYRTRHPGELEAYHLKSKRYWSRIETFTAKDRLCQVTRENFALLRETSIAPVEYDTKKEENARKTRDQTTIYKLNRNLGRVVRGTCVNRLFSPWVGARSAIRSRYTLDGAPIVSIDLQAAQPTLMASLAADTNLLRDCKTDALYQGIMGLLKTEDRGQAKEKFMAYAYGKPRGNYPGHREVFQVQEWMMERYPTTASFVLSEKKRNGHAQLSCDLQDREAALFVDGMMGDLTNEGIPVLTVHDALYIRQQDQGRAMEIADKHLSTEIGDNLYSLEDQPITVTPLYMSIIRLNGFLNR